MRWRFNLPSLYVFTSVWSNFWWRNLFKRNTHAAHTVVQGVFLLSLVLCGKSGSDTHTGLETNPNFWDQTAKLVASEMLLWPIFLQTTQIWIYKAWIPVNISLERSKSSHVRFFPTSVRFSSCSNSLAKLASFSMGRATSVVPAPRGTNS